MPRDEGAGMGLRIRRTDEVPGCCWRVDHVTNVSWTTVHTRTLLGALVAWLHAVLVS